MGRQVLGSSEGPRRFIGSGRFQRDPLGSGFISSAKGEGTSGCEIIQSLFLIYLNVGLLMRDAVFDYLICSGFINFLQCS